MSERHDRPPAPEPAEPATPTPATPEPARRASAVPEPMDSEPAAPAPITPAPLISVIMPAHDVAPFVAEAVRSVLAQDWPRLELIAVDDGSTDGTGEALEALAAEEAPRMVLRRQTNAGAAAARNAGLALARGDLLAFMDADDRWHPGLLRRLAGALAADPSLTMAVPRWRYVDAAGRPIGVETPGGGRHGAADLMGDNPVHSATGVVLRRAAAERAGAFDPDLRGCIDLDFWLRALGRDGVAASVEGAWADYRKRPDQITADWRRMARAWDRVQDKAAERGQGFSPAARSRARGRACLFWAALAHEAGDLAASRRLVAEAWARDPRHAAASRAAWVRTAAAAASLMPRPWHDALRARIRG